MIIVLNLVRIANPKIFYNKSKLKETQDPNFKIFINVIHKINDNMDNNNK